MPNFSTDRDHDQSHGDDLGPDRVHTGGHGDSGSDSTRVGHDAFAATDKHSEDRDDKGGGEEQVAAPKTPGRSNRGFAAMAPEERRAIASRGGQSQGKQNNPGNFANNRERAREAGRKGGQH